MRLADAQASPTVRSEGRHSARQSGAWELQVRPGPIGWKPVNYLLEVGFTPDVWAHRIDIHAAIARPMELTPAHDGRLVAAIVAEWAQIHGVRSSCT